MERERVKGMKKDQFLFNRYILHIYHEAGGETVSNKR